MVFLLRSRFNKKNLFLFLCKKSCLQFFNLQQLKIKGYSPILRLHDTISFFIDWHLLEMSEWQL